MTKAEIIEAIAAKVTDAKPFLRAFFLSGLTYKSKSELERIQKGVKVASDGLDINTP